MNGTLKNLFVPVKFRDFFLLQKVVVIIFAYLVGLPGADKPEVVRNDRHDDHVEHVVQQEGYGDGDQDQLPLSLGLLKLVPAVLPVLVHRHAHEGQLEVWYARHFSQIPFTAKIVFQSAMAAAAAVAAMGKALQLHSTRDRRVGGRASGLAGGLAWPW